jgi:hypothetical protein
MTKLFVVYNMGLLPELVSECKKQIQWGNSCDYDDVNGIGTGSDSQDLDHM